MKPHPPFIITSRLCPGLRLGDATLSLTGTDQSSEDRDRASFVLDFADGTTYAEDYLRGGAGGFQGPVGMFESFLSFLLAAVESLEFEQRHPGMTGQNTDMFPRHVVEWALDNKSDIESAWCDLCDDEVLPNEALIEEV